MANTKIRSYSLNFGKVQIVYSNVYLFSDRPQWPPEQRGQFYGFISGVANLTCEAKAEPPAKFTWLDRDNKPVEGGAIIVNEDRRWVGA
jgi:hypothetical protein